MKRLLLLVFAAVPALGQVSQLPADAVVPVVSSSQGASGANFKTELKMANPSERTSSGWLLLRPQNVAVRYELAPHTGASWADFVAGIGSSGAGSLDVVVESGDLPTFAVRSFDDQPSGTNGVTVPVVPIDAVLKSNDVAALIAPLDPVNFRFNIGVRALESGASAEFVVRRSNGTEKSRVTVSWGEHAFDQKAAEALLGTTLASGDSIEVSILSGSAVIYGSTVDNRTNDASLQVLRRN